MLKGFSAELEPRMAPDGDLNAIVDWAAKLVGAVARIAGVLHLAERRGGDTLISANTVEAAIEIGTYLLAHAQKVLGQMGASNPALTDARAVIAYLNDKKIETISRRDLHQALRKGHQGRFMKADSLDAPLDILREHGWLRLREHRQGKGKGRTSTVITVNPNKVPRAQKAQKAQKVERVVEAAVEGEAIEPIEAFELPPPLAETITEESIDFASLPDEQLHQAVHGAPRLPSGNHLVSYKHYQHGHRHLVAFWDEAGRMGLATAPEDGSYLHGLDDAGRAEMWFLELPMGSVLDLRYHPEFEEVEDEPSVGWTGLAKAAPSDTGLDAVDDDADLLDDDDVDDLYDSDAWNEVHEAVMNV